MQHMPVVFVGHGSPMNALEDNRFTRQWSLLGERLGRPEAILSVSAHWYTQGTRVSDASAPQMIYDMYGFPQALYRVTYPASGSPALAKQVKGLLGDAVQTDGSWGLDHGTWSVLKWIYPKADIPVVQLSVDQDANPEELYKTGRALRSLRDQGVLILGSGNVVHNLSLVSWDSEGGYPWADAFDRYIRDAVLARNDGGVLRYRDAGDSAANAFVTLDHFAPLPVVLGAADEGAKAEVFNDERVMGSLSMTSYVLG
jgi:4,5-DOPA dioxygenase extradiol